MSSMLAKKMRHDSAPPCNAWPVAADVKTHFRCVIPSGESTFTVPVPQHHLQDSRRRFFFNELHLTPDFYSLDAEKLKLDADPELDRIVERNVQVKVHFNDAKAGLAPPYEHSTSLSKMVDAVAAINEHFESKKPSFLHITPFFLDWVDLAMQPYKESSDYVPALANLYYGSNYDSTLHKDALPLSARGVKNVNNHKLPVTGSLDDDFAFLNRIRLRLWMAPYTRAVFSNVQVFVESLGFKEDQLGRVTTRQHHLANTRAYCVPMAVAAAAPNFDLVKTAFRLTLFPSSTFLGSRIKQINMVQRDWIDNDKLALTLIQAFKQSSRSLNIDFSLNYNKGEKKFVFTMPDSASLIVQVACDADFAHRLGYGYETVISRGMQPLEQTERHKIDDAQKRAVSVVFDTGPIVCTLDQVSSNTTSGSLYQAVAALYPKASGTLSMPRPMCQCAATQSAASANGVQLSATTHTSATTVPVRFRLLRIYDDQTTADFAWVCDGYVYGVLQGTCPPPTAAYL